MPRCIGRLTCNRSCICLNWEVISSNHLALQNQMSASSRTKSLSFKLSKVGHQQHIEQATCSSRAVLIYSVKSIGSRNGASCFVKRQSAPPITGHLRQRKVSQNRGPKKGCFFGFPSTTTNPKGASKSMGSFTGNAEAPCHRGMVDVHQDLRRFGYAVLAFSTLTSSTPPDQKETGSIFEACKLVCCLVACMPSDSKTPRQSILVKEPATVVF